MPTSVPTLPSPVAVTGWRSAVITTAMITPAVVPTCGWRAWDVNLNAIAMGEGLLFAFVERDHHVVDGGTGTDVGVIETCGAWGRKKGPTFVVSADLEKDVVRTVRECIP